MEKLRTIKQAVQDLRSSDPGCCLTEWGLRQLVKEGELPCIMIGSKQLVSIESIERYVDSKLSVKEYRGNTK